MWNNVVQPDRPQNTIRRMRIACWTTNVTVTHSEYVALVGVARQQCLLKRALLLRLYYMAVLFIMHSK
jgi:hypothetical protein